MIYTAYPLIEVGEQQLVDVRYAPLATKMVRRRKRSEVPLATVPHFYLRLPACLEQRASHNFGPF